MNPHDDLDARLAAALHRRASDVSLAPRGLGDVRRRVQRRRRRAASVGAAAVAVPALAGIGWLATHQGESGSSAGSPPLDSLSGLAPTTTGSGQVSWRCAGPLGEDGGYAYYQQCDLVGPGMEPVLTTVEGVASEIETTMPFAVGTFPPLTTIATGWVGTVLVVDATGTTVDGSTLPAELLVQALTAGGSPYVLEVLTADRTSPESMVMPVADDADSQANAHVLADYLAIGGFDTWDPSNWTSGATIPGDLAMVVVLGEDWPQHLTYSPNLPATTTTTIAPGGTPADPAVQTTTTGPCLQSYELQAGDTPAGVAAVFGVTLDDLASVNVGNADFDTFVVGAVISIPMYDC